MHRVLSFLLAFSGSLSTLQALAQTASSSIAGNLTRGDGYQDLVVTKTSSFPANTSSASPPTQTASMQNVRDVSSISVKEFGAVGNGSTNDYAAISNALAYARTNGVCIYFPAGNYLIQSQLVWNSEATLCLRGEQSTTSFIFYKGTSTITGGALEVHNTTTRGNNYYSNIKLSNIGFAANSSAQYALHLWRTTGTIDSVDVMGGSASAFEGADFNAQQDVRNLRVNPLFFNPGSVGCVNGLTFDDDGTYPSGQFSLDTPNIGGCSGIGLNFADAGAITVNNAQESGAKTGFYIAAPLGNNGNGIHFNDCLLNELATQPSKVMSGGNFFTNTNLGMVQTQVYGSNNTFNGHNLGTVMVESGATGNVFENNNLSNTSTDSGTGTRGWANTMNGGEPTVAGFASIDELAYYLDGCLLFTQSAGSPMAEGCNGYLIISPDGGTTKIYIQDAGAAFGSIPITTSSTVSADGGFIVNRNTVIPSTATGNTGNSAGKVDLVQTCTTGSITPASTAGGIATGTCRISAAATGHAGAAAATDGSVQGILIPQVSVDGITATVTLTTVVAGSPAAKSYNVTVF